MPKLREHPKLSWERRPLHWPPDPTGWASAGHRVLRDPREVAQGVLMNAKWRAAKGEDHLPHLLLRIKLPDGAEFTHALQVDAPDFLRVLEREFRSYFGKATLEELGDLELVDA